MGRIAWAIAVAVLSARVIGCQTTQGLIRGHLINSRTGEGIVGGVVTCENTATRARAETRSGDGGAFVFAALSPGTYRLRAEAAAHQPQEVYELELAVAAQLQLDFHLRNRDDVFEQARHLSVFMPEPRPVVTFYGPDVDTSRLGTFEAPRARPRGVESTVSRVIDGAQIRDLPLAGRDVYTMLATQAGVTSDAATSRGLGLAVNGQRPTASNFLLDGLENNNYLITGALTPVAPEAIEEYRFSISNFSAEYGRSAGFLANAVTRQGGAEWHGTGYFYLKNDALNGNARPPLNEVQPGFTVGGPLKGEALRAAVALEYVRFRSSREPENFRFPSIAALDAIRPGSIAAGLLRQFPAPAGDSVELRRPESLDRYLALPRVDSVLSDHRVMARVGIARIRKPDFIWSPYPDFVSPLTERILSPGIGWIASRRGITFETRAGWSIDDLRFDRTHSEVPYLVSSCVAERSPCYTYPGSPGFYSYRNRSRTTELSTSAIGTRGRHIWKAGGAMLLRAIDGYLAFGRDGQYYFTDLAALAFDKPSTLYTGVKRGSVRETPDYDREYTYQQFSAFAQDSFALTPRLVVNAGLRYESFGVPSNSGRVKDRAVELGAGANIAERVAAARLGDASVRELYAADHNDWAARAGFSWSPAASANTTIRGAYGIFYDRPFDNLWQNLRSNSFGLGTAILRGERTDFTRPVAEALAAPTDVNLNEAFSKLTLYQPGIRTSYVQSYFAGVERRLSESFALEVNGLGSLGRKLITTDLINRAFSLSTTIPQNPLRRLNPGLPDLYYRAGQGNSNYHALAVTARYRTRRAQAQVAYTWSHAIDNQSEPLAGDFFDLSFTATAARARSAFVRQFDSGIDRGNADFDQKHNLVVWSIWDVWRGWKIAQLAAFRSGFPYSVNAGKVLLFDPTENNRANVLNAVVTDGSPIPGGKKLLRREAFGFPALGSAGNMGRNALTGPGMFNIDVSLSRTMALPWWREGVRLTVRADAFNVLNHANLNQPETFLGSPNFGNASYGRQGVASTFPLVAPFRETARQVQLLVRVEF